MKKITMMQKMAVAAREMKANFRVLGPKWVMRWILVDMIPVAGCVGMVALDVFCIRVAVAAGIWSPARWDGIFSVAGAVITWVMATLMFFLAVRYGVSVVRGLKESWEEMNAVRREIS